MQNELLPPLRRILLGMGCDVCADYGVVGVMKEFAIGAWLLLALGALGWGYIWLCDKWPVFGLLPVFILMSGAAYLLGLYVTESFKKK